MFSSSFCSSENYNVLILILRGVECCRLVDYFAALKEIKRALSTSFAICFRDTISVHCSIVINSMSST